MLNIIDRRVTQLHFWVTTAEHGVIELNDDFSFTLKVDEALFLSGEVGGRKALPAARENG